MSTSAQRTLTVSSSGQRGLVWPVAQPIDDLDYSIDISALLTDSNDWVTSVEWSIRPHGSGELVASTLRVVGGLITADMTGGIPGRFYSIRVIVGTLLGNSFVWFVQLRVGAATETYPRTPPEHDDYGTALTMTTTTVATSALANSKVLKSSAGSLFAVNLWASASGFFVLLDATAVPSDGTVAPVKWWAFDASGGESIDLQLNPAISLSTGIVIAFSSATNPYTLTTPGSASAAISGEIA